MTDNPETPARDTIPPILIIPPHKQGVDEKDAPPKDDSPQQLVLGFIFGIAFGFLLQKGGVAKYEVLMGQLLLTDFTVPSSLTRT